MADDPSPMICLERPNCARYLSVEEAARDDYKFLTFDAQKHVHVLRLRETGIALDNATYFLQYLDRIRADPVMLHQATIKHGFSDPLDFEKYLANIEHLTRCIQQAALNALVQNSLEMLESNPRNRHKRFEQPQNQSEDWFSEWSSDRPPLNSTMPWNIKPSLVVLWGVCWMFYTPNESVNSSRHTPDESWYTQPQSTDWISQTSVTASESAMEYSNPADTTNIQQPEPLLSHSTTLRGRSPSVRLGHVSSPQIDMIGRMNSSRYTQDMTQTSPMPGHMDTSNNYHGQFLRQATPNLDSLDKPAISSAGTRSPRTSSTRSPQPGTSDIGGYPSVTPTSVWSPNPNPHANYNISHIDQWSQPGFENGASTRISYPPHSIRDPYSIANISNTSSTHGWSMAPSFDYPQSALYVPTTNPVYPPSPGNHRSDRGQSRASTNISRHPSPAGSMAQSPPFDTSDGSPRQSGNSERPRDSGGNMTCDHPKCSKNPPTFARKCEWKKHKDTHTRPYVCRVPGCEKIQGFTYSGGLLRHEREVHHQHGGPKLPRYCPHKDCKRSTGQGFSRKENLNEHLRRVHRGIGLADVSLKSEPQQSPSISNLILPSQHNISDPLAGRKRRRGIDEAEDDSLSPSIPDIGDLMQTLDDLREEVKNLRHDVAMRDAKISHLQHTLKLQTSGHLN